MKITQYKAVCFAILAAMLYAISAPVSKLLLREIPATLMASLLYLGAGLGMFLLGFVRRRKDKERAEARLTRQELPFTIAMVVLDIAAPIFLMVGLTMTTSATASLLNNFEIVATSLIALFIFKESISRQLWISIALITVASAILSVEDIRNISLSFGSIFVLLACVCWGLENNCTRKLSLKDPLEIVVIKGFGSGIGALFIALALGERTSNLPYLAMALLLGFFAYGLSIFFYIYAQRELGAARTSAYYALAPFLGVGLSLIIFQEMPTISFIIALVIMIIGTYFTTVEEHNHLHMHLAVTHEHGHVHEDGHHTHVHDQPVIGKHSHVHTHDVYTHSHKHTQDIHHVHSH
ncbi:DMT family transporter [Clostridium aminobutyricum]|uniref:EamA family transporter n=1 Tax=Clostridium aminobutyricum TaxID=33953 RepID=A0A939II97_CLOAM|nr:DMT family transporter [Clostridium aminobutyricum]MBN7772348.1 EamA family transporter [Clostridium aminobutyricum]